MGQADTGGVTEQTSEKTEARASDAYISPLVDFLLLFTLTVAVSLSAVVVL